MAILSDPELIEQLGEILNKISYLSNEVEIGDLAEDALELIVDVPTKICLRSLGKTLN